ncbi:MAG: PorT family protein [Bacteroidia bacterium]|nr:PorT family protein [Bacteroidales bacterium]NCD41464.1 PorT family protein [Bacteroidia bacterium]MDD2322615.1 porin family protein [Bacteroidales bacterium]MDD3010012.1 porin family protein [Bacteroidales bacterium]MDD3960961.1 porin family protein [Bacteroidales bacterium]
MIKKACILIIALTLPFTSLVQGQGIFDFGMKGGYTSNKMAVSLVDVEEGLTESFHAGIFARLNLSRIFLQPEAYFINKGGILTETVDGIKLQSDFEFRSIDFPLLVGIKLIDSDKVNLRIMAGPAASRIVNSEMSLTETFNTLSEQTFNHAFYSVQAGVGLDIFMFTLDLRTEAGLTNLSFFNPGFSLYHRTINISLGIKLL